MVGVFTGVLHVYVIFAQQCTNMISVSTSSSLIRSHNVKGLISPQMVYPQVYHVGQSISRVICLAFKEDFQTFVEK